MLSEPLTTGQEEPGILSAICWPVWTLEASAAPVLGSRPLGEGPQNAALLYAVGREEGGRNRTAPGFQAQLLQGGPPRGLGVSHRLAGLASDAPALRLLTTNMTGFSSIGPRFDRC